jgi:hypothetical protein
MTALSIVLPALFGASILVVEFQRGRVPGAIDFLRGASAFFFVAFCVSPVYLAFVAIDDHSPWAWLQNGSESERVLASLAAALCYLVVVLAYRRFARLRSRGHRPPRPAVLATVTPTTAWRVGLLCTSAGIVAFVAYAWDAGGIITVLRNSMIMRVVGDENLVGRLAFLKNASLVAIAGSYLLMGAQTGTGETKLLARVVAWVSYLASLVILYHLAGRLLVVLYLAVFALVRPYSGRRMGIARTAGLVLSGLAVAVLGKQLFNFYIYRDGLDAQIGRVWLETNDVLSTLMFEFSFPYGNMCALVKHVPSDLPYRLFLDVPLSIIRLLPKAFFGLNLPNSASRDYSIWQGLGIGTELPVDLVSFGYISLGVLGIVIVGYVFGATLRVADDTLSWRSPVVAPLRVAWIQFLGTRVMYGDPAHGIVSGFGLAVVTVLLVVWARLAFVGAQPPHRTREAVAGVPLGWPRRRR